MPAYDGFVKYPMGKIDKGEWCECCGRFNTRNVTCTGIGVMGEKVLMILRKKDPQAGWWALPGGYLGWDETVEKCCERECLEETGHEVKVKGLVGVYSSPERDLDGRQNVDCCFEVVVGKRMEGFDDEVVETKWFDLKELPEKIAFDHRQMILDFVEKYQKPNTK